MWRPPRWKNPFKGISVLTEDKQTQYCIDNVYEAGSDAMLEELRKTGSHHDKDSLSVLAGKPGTLVFIPDEPDEEEK